MLHVSTQPAFSLAIRDDVIGAVRHHAGALPQISIDYEPEIKAIWLTIKPQPKPVFTLDLLASVGKVQQAIWALWGKNTSDRNSPVKFLAFRGEGPVFTLGGDLDFYLDCLAKGDRAALQEYARVSVEGAAWNASGCRGSVITLATIHGKAIGGGIDAPRSCQIMIAERGATFVYPEVKFNHFPITAAPVLARRVGDRVAEEVLMSGTEFDAYEFAARGLLEGVVESGAGEDWVRAYCRETLPMHHARKAIFAALHARHRHFEDDLRFNADLWVDCMLRMPPTEISKLQRISQMQERMLSRMFAA
ncbi:MAG: crotonase/enoyl-CoA hydratase family protein [Bosea sp. (in: a-proteobacteria)]